MLQRIEAFLGKLVFIAVSLGVILIVGRAIWLDPSNLVVLGPIFCAASGVALYVLFFCGLVEFGKKIEKLDNLDRL